MKMGPAAEARCLWRVMSHRVEYPSLTAAAEAVARREEMSKEAGRRWAVQAQVDGGQRWGATSEVLAEIRALKAKVRGFEEDNEILRRALILLGAGDVEHSTAGWGAVRSTV